MFNAMMRPRLDLGETAISQVQALGFDPADVRNIIVTHLDIDHAGGLPDFPAAKVHLWTREYERDAEGRRCASVCATRSAPRTGHTVRSGLPTTSTGTSGCGFESVRLLPDSDPEILMIPLPGHTLGHTAIAVRRPDGWLLHCGDAYFYRDEVSTPPNCPRGLRAFQVVVEANGKVRRQNQERLRELAQRHAGEVELICAHDPVLLDRAQSGGESRSAYVTV